jgi:hypothetical protein
MLDISFVLVATGPIYKGRAPANWHGNESPLENDAMEVDVVLKIELCDASRQQMDCEWRVYDALRSEISAGAGFAPARLSRDENFEIEGEVSAVNVLATAALGSDLGRLIDAARNNRFSLKTVLKIGINR